MQIINNNSTVTSKPIKWRFRNSPMYKNIATGSSIYTIKHTWPTSEFENKKLQKKAGYQDNEPGCFWVRDEHLEGTMPCYGLPALYSYFWGQAPGA
ncbi:hypothetical protein BGAL_0022g00130 [Botrytis galanthina]|uniref:Uncharacterized protein n=1 Tax=Botrytis galanthina TaxID=278940 RepID=A0A4S8R993_9HELO|nr:hypothetical protein BGAL_0022g00130 [Botrytis galanthina]